MENMVEEKFDFTAKAKKNLIILVGVGVLLTIIGIVGIAMGGGHHAPHGEEVAAAAEGGHHGFHWIKRVYANLWINNVFFVGLALVGVLFFAIHYAAQAGWSAGINRIALALGAWLPMAGVLMLGVFLVVYFVPHYSIFHWTHHSLYDPTSEEFDAIITGKGGYFFWPLELGSFPLFFLIRMIVFFGGWYLLFTKLKDIAYREGLEEDGIRKWYESRKFSAIFIVFFAVSSSIAAWDWVMSIDTHWFSTMYGWYVFASWWVAGLALITLIVLWLKDKGYLAIVNANHLHDLGKFMFAFSIFWTYIWFSQFLLIYYANIPEESIYFVERWKNDQYAPVFYFNLIANFCLPFLILMTRDSKRYSRILKLVAAIILIGHWFDFYLMVTPGTLTTHGGFGPLEVGLAFVYTGVFLYVVLNQLSKGSLFAKNDPMLEESLHHHI